MPGEGHHAIYRLSLYQNALLDPFALFSLKRLKHSDRAVTINLNTLIEQSKSFRVNLITALNSEARIACEDNGL